jgi:hypothetical protein
VAFIQIIDCRTSKVDEMQALQQAFAERNGALVDGPMAFHDLDVVDDRS